MKLKYKKELEEKSIGELKSLLKEKRKELLGLKMEKAKNKLKNTKLMFLIRKEIAYILTKIQEKGVDK